MMEAPFLPLLYPIRRLALQIGIGGLLLFFIGLYSQPQLFFAAYLFAYLFWLGISLGALAMVMIHHLTGGRWGNLIRGSIEAATQALPLMALLFLPLFFGLSDLYAWTHPEVIAEQPLLQKKSSYLNVPFFSIRAVSYFIIWWGLTHWLTHWSAEQARNSRPEIILRLRCLSAGGMILYSLSVTFAAIDWGMSLVPQWYSTAFGLLWGVGQVVSALAFAIITAAVLSKNYSLAKFFTPDGFHDLGNFLLLLIMLWAYLALMQYLVIWSEDLPPETSWYLPRLQGAWQKLTIAVFFLHFFLPFAALLSRHVKRTIPLLAGIAAAVLLAHLMETFWVVVPSLRPPSLELYGSAVVASVGVGGLWLATVLSYLQKKPLVVPLSSAAKPPKARLVLPGGETARHRRHETTDVSGRSIVWLALLLLAALVVIAFIVFSLFVYFGNR